MAKTSSDMTTDIETAVDNPARAVVDGQDVTPQSIPDLIEADKYLAAKRAAAQQHRGFTFTRIRLPGANG